ncbi:MAG: DMT family transporter, partial [Pseudomonadota bacterium]
AVTWGAATVLLKAVNWKMGVLALSGWQFLLGSGPLILAAVTLGDLGSLLRVDYLTGGALAFSALIPMIFCQAVWFAVVRRLPTSLASTGTLLVPPLGVYFSALILDETVGPYEVAALLLVIAALVLILPGFNWRASLRPQPESRPE